MGLSNSDAKKIAKYLHQEMEINNETVSNNEENKQVVVDQPDEEGQTTSKKLVGFWRITFSHLGWYLVNNYKKILLALGLILVLYILVDLFGLYLLVFFVVSSIVLTVLIFFIRNKDKIYLIVTSAQPETKDSFEVWSMSHHRFNQYDKKGDVNPIDTAYGAAYIVEEFDRDNKILKMSYRHTNLDFWTRKKAFLDLKDKAIKVSDTLDNTTLLQEYNVHSKSRKKAQRVLEIIQKALLPDESRSLTQENKYKQFIAEVDADLKKYKESKRIDKREGVNNDEG